MSGGADDPARVPRWVVAHGVGQRQHLDEFFPEAQLRVVMSPAEFLAHCAAAFHGADGRMDVREDRVERAAARLRAGLPLDAAFLEVDVLSGRVLREEGRHRALAAERLGMAGIPVILYAWLPGTGFAGGFAGALRERFGWAPWMEAEHFAGTAAR